VGRGVPHSICDTVTSMSSPDLGVTSYYTLGFSCSQF
jgi:hypothetical protein